MPTSTAPIVILGRRAYRLVQGDIQIATVDDDSRVHASWSYIDLDDWNHECDQAMAMLGGVATRLALDHLNDFAQTHGRGGARLSATEWSPYFEEADRALAESARARPL